MKTIHRAALVLLVVGAASCVAYGQDPYQRPPSTPPGYGSQPGYQPGYQPGPQPGSQPGYQPGYPQGGDYGYQGQYGTPDYEVGFFYQELSPFGDWIYTYEYGWTWLPRNVSIGWRPYANGRWVWSDFGWFWVSYEPFGWATYHYGRWTPHPRFGWVWCPGSTWGPSWVSWQYGQGYVGWAPLPPEVGFEIGIGLRLGGLSLGVAIQPSAYTFVDERRFLEPDLGQYYVPAARNVTIIKETTNVTNYTYVDNRVVNRGIDSQRIERATGRRVTSMRIAETALAKTESVRGDEIVVYKPPRERIASVKVDENKPGRGRKEIREQQPAPGQRSPRAESQRAESPRAPAARAEIEVAPRVKPEPRVDPEELRRKHQKEAEELQVFERTERQKLEQAQRQEREKVKAQPRADAGAIERRHAEEKKALEEELKRSKQQLDARLEVEEKAAHAEPPGKQQADEKKAAAKKEADKKEADKKAQEKKDAAKKKKPQSDAPPPPRR